MLLSRNRKRSHFGLSLRQYRVYLAGRGGQTATPNNPFQSRHIQILPPPTGESMSGAKSQKGSLLVIFALPVRCDKILEPSGVTFELRGASSQLHP
jgi:hypothetical protein